MTSSELVDPVSVDIAAAYWLHLERARVRAIAVRQRRDGERDEHATTQEQLALVEQRLAKRDAQSETARDLRLASVLRLSVTELDLVWSVVAATMDPSLSTHIRDLAGGEARFGISIAVHSILAGLDDNVARLLALALSPHHPLIRYGLIEWGGDAVPAARPLVASRRLAAFLAGDDRIDPAVATVGGVVQVTDEPRYDDAQVQCVKQLANALGSDAPVLIILEGPVDVGKRTAAAIAALARKQMVIQIDAARVAPTTSDIVAAFVALRRECLLVDAIPLVAHLDAMLGEERESRDRLRAVARLIDETPVSMIVTSTRAGLDLGTQRTVLRLAMPVPDARTRMALWTDALDPDSSADVESLSVRYRLGAGGIQRAVAAARVLSPATTLRTTDLVAGVRHGIAERLGELARRVEVRQGWEDLVVSPDTLDQIKGLIARVRHGHLVFEQWGFGGKLPRGLGTAALFSGPPGTGKTMVAGLIARELDLELYQVDLSRVVSKWVGETEKQLSSIFDAAEAGHALLLFDEADSLFAKRTEVKSANDRYANLEVNYLLQRIESFGGLSILTTNLDTSIDPALRRRLASHIVFYPPDIDERTTLWQGLLPALAPRGTDIDFEALARSFPDMTGANIRNSVIAAAFLAASEGGNITQEHLERAGRGEYRAMGRVVR